MKSFQYKMFEKSDKSISELHNKLIEADNNYDSLMQKKASTLNRLATSSDKLASKQKEYIETLVRLNFKKAEHENKFDSTIKALKEAEQNCQIAIDQSAREKYNLAIMENSFTQEKIKKQILLSTKCVQETHLSYTDNQLYIATSNHENAKKNQQNIRPENFFYDAVVEEKHKTSICGINADPYYTYHIERRFNQAQYNQTQNEALKQINNTRQVIALREKAIETVKNALNDSKKAINQSEEIIKQTTNAKKNAEDISIKKEQDFGDKLDLMKGLVEQKREAFEEIIKTEQNIHEVQLTYDKANIEFKELDQEIKHIEEQIRLADIERDKLFKELYYQDLLEEKGDLLLAIQFQEIEAANKLRDNDIKAKEEEKFLQQEMLSAKQAQQEMIDSLEKMQKLIFAKVSSLSLKDRAYLLSQLADNPDADNMITEIKAQGYDVDYYSFLTGQDLTNNSSEDTLHDQFEYNSEYEASYGKDVSGALWDN